MNLSDIKSFLDKNKGRREQLQETISNLKENIKEKKRDLRRHEEALEIIKTAGLETQKQLQNHISDITTLCLESVFNYPYKLNVEFVQRRDKTETDLFFTRGENQSERIDPSDASGGGAVLIGALALRIASWSMKTPKSRNVLLLDEPFHFLHGESPIGGNLLSRASHLLSQISKQLDLQIIVVSYSPELTEHADKVIEVTGKISNKYFISEVKER